MFSNDIHQLIISPSAHLVLLKDGGVKYLKRKSVVSISKMLEDGKKRPVYFVIRDDYSGALYYELRISHDLSEVADFLYNAWNKKDKELNRPFGMPKILRVSRIVADHIPNVLKNLLQHNIDVHPPQDGFSSGVRVIRTLENHIKFFCYKEGVPLTLAIQGLDSFMFSPYDKAVQRRFQIWYEGIKGTNLIVPGGDRECFVNLLNSPHLTLFHK